MLEGGYLRASGEDASPTSLRSCVAAHVRALRAPPLVEAFGAPDAHGAMGTALCIGAYVAGVVKDLPRIPRARAPSEPTAASEEGRAALLRLRKVWHTQLAASTKRVAADEKWRVANNSVATAVLKGMGVVAPCVPALPLPFSQTMMLKTSIALGIGGSDLVGSSGGPGGTAAKTGEEGQREERIAAVGGGSVKDKSAIALLAAWREREPPRADVAEQEAAAAMPPSPSAGGRMKSRKRSRTGGV